MKELADLRERGKDSLVEGIFEGISDTFGIVADTGVSIFHSIARGLKHVTNDTVDVVDSIGDDIASIFGPVGGLGVFVLYVLNLGIIVYLGYRHVVDYRMRDAWQETPPRLPPKMNRE